MPCDLRLFVLLLPLAILSTQCDQTELPTGPVCDCVCSNERVPACYQRGRDDCPPSPVCVSDQECEAFCQSDALCGEAEPNYARCRDLEDPDRNAELYCVQIPQCADVTEAQCRERLEPFDCTFEWLFYRICVAEEGCDTLQCRGLLESWEGCKAEGGQGVR